MVRVWHLEAMRKLPLFQWNGPVRILSTQKQMKAATNKLLNEMVIGFDVEYSRYQEPALVQMATHDCVYLFRVLDPRKQLEFLNPVLESSRVLKVGVGVHGDLGRIRPFNVSPRNFKDVPDVTVPLGFQQRGLQTLSAAVLGKFVAKKKPKSKKWTDDVLSQKQVIYAATDAQAARMIYVTAIMMTKMK